MTRYIVPSVLAVLMVGAVAAVSVGMQQAFLAPSLGAAAFSQVMHADEKSSYPYNLIVGQLIGAIAGFVGVFAAGQVHAHPMTGAGGLPAGRILAVAIAMFVACIAQIAARARTPTGGATALVVALGIESVSVLGALRTVAGIAMMAVLGEWARRFVLEVRATEEHSAEHS